MEGQDTPFQGLAFRNSLAHRGASSGALEVVFNQQSSCLGRTSRTTTLPQAQRYCRGCLLPYLNRLPAMQLPRPVVGPSRTAPSSEIPPFGPCRRTSPFATRIRSSSGSFRGRRGMADFYTRPPCVSRAADGFLRGAAVRRREEEEERRPTSHLVRVAWTLLTWRWMRLRRRDRWERCGRCWWRAGRRPRSGCGSCGGPTPADSAPSWPCTAVPLVQQKAC